MNGTTRKLLAFAALFCSLFLSGCLEKTLFPPVLLTITDVTPYKVLPTVAEASGTANLPTVVVSVRADSQVPAKMTGFAVSYRTSVGEAVPSLAIPFTPYDLVLTTGGTTAITFSPYTPRVVTLFQETSSDIAPLMATILITIEDQNRNTVHKEAHCLLYEPE